MKFSMRALICCWRTSTSAWILYLYPDCTKTRRIKRIDALLREFNVLHILWAVILLIVVSGWKQGRFIKVDQNKPSESAFISAIRSRKIKLQNICEVKSCPLTWGTPHKENWLMFWRRWSWPQDFTLKYLTMPGHLPTLCELAKWDRSWENLVHGKRRKKTRRIEHSEIIACM
jgi:hypothetical protein